MHLEKSDSNKNRCPQNFVKGDRAKKGTPIAEQNNPKEAASNSHDHSNQTQNQIEQILIKT